MFAVVDIGGKQYKVAPGDRLEVAKIAGKVGEELSLTNVKLLVDAERTKIGTRLVKGAKVTAKIIAQGKGEKIDVRRFKAKVRERRHIGFRPQVTTLEITNISA